MHEVDVKEAISALYDGGTMTQQALAAELGCTQANVHYHLNNQAKKSRAPAVLVERIKIAFARRNMVVPMCDPHDGAV